MNGLKSIRYRCNITIGELAKELKVSRQLISAWENGKKTISQTRLKTLQEFFGLDSKFFGELTEELEEELNGKCMFRYKYGEKEIFLYKVNPGVENIYNIPVFFSCGNEMLLDQDVVQMRKRKEAALKRIDEIMDPADSSSMWDTLGRINQRKWMYDALSDLIDQRKKIELQYSSLYMKCIRGMLAGALYSQGLISEEEIKQRFGTDGFEMYDFTDWVKRIAEEIKEIVDEKSRLLDAKWEELRQYPVDSKEEVYEKMSIDEQLKEMEKDHKEHEKMMVDYRKQKAESLIKQ